MITIVDAVMGTGKSTAMFTRVNTEVSQKFIIITPLTAEVTRYKEELSSAFKGKRTDIVALDEKKSRTKKQRFLEAVSDGKTVITTHSLFSQLTKEDFTRFSNIDQYSLIIDETISLVDSSGLLSGDLQDLLALKYVETVNDRKIDGLKYYQLLPKGEEYKARGGALKKTLESISGKHVYEVNRTNILFVVPPEKLTAFQDVTIMSYMFLESETHAWISLFKLQCVHKELLRDGSGHKQVKHSGIYYGNQFSKRLTVYDNPINDIGVKNPKSPVGTPLTVTWFTHKSTARRKEIEELKKNTRTFFRHMKRTHGAQKTNMLWSCFGDYKDKLRHGEFDDKKLDQDGKWKNWIPYNYRATNKFSDRHFVAYLVNVHPPQNLFEFFKRNKVPFNRDTFALSTLLQCIWRSAIRKEKESVTLYLPSERMRTLLDIWMDNPVLKASRGSK